MKMNFRGLTASFAQIAPDIVRVTLSADDQAPGHSQIVLPEALSAARDTLSGFEAALDRGRLIIGHDGRPLLAICDCTLTPVDIVRYSTNGERPEVEVVKTVDGERTVIRNLRPHKLRKAYAGQLCLSLKDDEAVYGLGQDEDGVFNYRGHCRYLYQHNMMIPMPVFYSSAGYGLLFDCASLMTFDDTQAHTRIAFDAVRLIDFYLIRGTADDFIRGYRFLTGKATLPPKWAFGYIQSKEKYTTGDELVGIAQRYRALNVPIDCVVQDWKTWPGDAWGQKTVDKARYPDLSRMNAALHDLGVHSMVSVWPNMAQGCPNHREFEESGLLLGDYSTYDAFSQAGRDTYWNQIMEELYPGGFDSWWCDSTEPFTSPDWCGEVLLPPERRYELVGGEHKKYLDPEQANLYAVMHAKGMYEHQASADKNRRMLNLTRSGYAGIQRYGAVLWAGDTSATWAELRREVAKGLSMSVSGIPYWTVDVGAFFVGSLACWRKWSGNPEAKPVWFWRGDYEDGVANMGYRELYVRWLQFGALLPLFRSHGTDTPREIWHFGEKGDALYDAIEQAIRLRYRLLPYIYSVAAHAAYDDGTMLKSLAMNYPADPNCKELASQFLLGDHLLVCPVMEPMYYGQDGHPIAHDRRHSCYLPAGDDWYRYGTAERLCGGQTVTVEAGIDVIPLFVKAGSVIPVQGDVSHALENTTHFALTVYPGADGSFTFYNDDGVSASPAQCDRIDLCWNDALGTLTLTPRNRWAHHPLDFHVVCGDRRARVDMGDAAVSLPL